MKYKVPLIEGGVSNLSGSDFQMDSRYMVKGIVKKNPVL